MKILGCMSKLQSEIKFFIAELFKTKVDKTSMAKRNKDFLAKTLPVWEDEKFSRKLTVEFGGMDVPCEAC